MTVSNSVTHDTYMKIIIPFFAVLNLAVVILLPAIATINGKLFHSDLAIEIIANEHLSEPIILFLFGTGIIGLAGILRKKIIVKNS